MSPSFPSARRAAIAAIACLAAASVGWSAGKVPYSAQEIQPLLLGTEVPSVEVLSIDGAELNLRKAIGKKPAVVIFYRGGW
jgi:hypothetical protein